MTEIAYPPRPFAALVVFAAPVVVQIGQFGQFSNHQGCEEGETARKLTPNAAERERRGRCGLQ